MSRFGTDFSSNRTQQDTSLEERLKADLERPIEAPKKDSEIPPLPPEVDFPHPASVLRKATKERIQEEQRKEQASVRQADDMEELADRSHSRSLLSSQNREAQTVKRTYVSPVSDEFEEELDEPVQDEESALISRNQIIFWSIVAIFLYVAFLGVGIHFTPMQDGEPKRITMDDRRNATFLSELDPYITYIQDQHNIIVNSADNYTAGTVSADELNETMQQAKKALESKKKELVDLTAPSTYEGMKSKVIELYSLQIVFCDDVSGFLQNQSEKNQEATKEANQRYLDAAKIFFDTYDQQSEVMP